MKLVVSLGLERQCRLGTYSLGVARIRNEAIVVQDLRCCAAMRVQAWKRSGRLLFTILGGIVPFVKNILLDPVDDADTR